MLTKEGKHAIIGSLVSDIRNVIKYLFNGSGKFQGGYFNVGDIQGSEGDSLKVNLSNGVWEDFAGGGKGDIIELWVRKYGSFNIAMNEIHSYLNIPRFKDTVEKKTKAFTKPPKDWKELEYGSDVYNYLTIDRKISPEILSLYSVREKTDERGACYVFLSRTTDGQLCGAKYTNIKRKEGKKVEYQSKNPLSVLWGMSAVAEGNNSIIITEGQIDAMSWAEQGVSNVVSIPMGTNNTDWVAHSWDWISRFKTVILCFDGDEAGQKALDVVSRKIGIERCKYITIPRYKDPNDAHVNGFDLKSLLSTAKDFKPSKLVSAGELVDEAWERVLRGRRELQGIPFMSWEGEDTINFRLRPREMTLYTGYPGSGKSSLLYQEVANLIFQWDQKVVVASLEEDAEEISMLIAIAGAASLFGSNQKKLFYEIYKEMTSKLFFYHHRGRAKHKEVLEACEFCIRRYGAQHLIFDSVAKTDLNIENSEEANAFVSAICESMTETGAHYHVVAHARKGKDNDFNEIPRLQEIKGAASFGIETFNAITMWRNIPKENLMKHGAKTAGSDGNFKTKGGENYGGKTYNMHEINRDWADALLVISKQKVGGETGQYDVWFDRDSYRFKRSFMEESKPYYKPLIESSGDDNDLEDFDD